MKKHLTFFSTVLFCMVCVFTLSSCDDDDNNRIDYEQGVPVVAKSFVANHFNNLEVLYAEREGSGYEVTFTNGLEIDFDSEGNWRKIDANKNPMPASVLLLLDTRIVEYINTNYPNNTIEEIERKGSNIEIELNNDVDLLFNASGELISTSGDNRPDEEVIPFENLPQVSKDFLNTHFANISVAKVEKDRDKFEVDLSNGAEVDFYLDGSMKSVEVTSLDGVPQAIMLPAIIDYVKANFSSKVVMEYSKLPAFFTGEYANGYKAELSGKPEIELFFSKDGNFLKRIND